MPAAAPITSQFYVSLALVLSAFLQPLFSGEATAFQADSPDRELLPHLAEMVLPSADELLKADAADNSYDWIVLKSDETVIVANPVHPRPDTLAGIQEERKELEAVKPKDDASREQRRVRLEELGSLLVTLPGDALTEYRLPLLQVGKVILFEELILQRIDELLAAGETVKVYDLLICVERGIPGWKETAPRFEKYLLVEARLQAKKKSYSAALSLLTELQKRNSSHPEVAGEYGQVTELMLVEALAEQNYAKVKFLVQRLARLFPDHPVAARWKARLSEVAGEKLGRGQQLMQQRQYAQAAELAREAESIWPTAGNSRVTYSQIISRYQVIRAGVDSFADSNIRFPAGLDSELRHRELTEVPLFEPVSGGEVTYFRSSFFEKWDPSDLGREVVLTLRESRPYWQSQPVLTAGQVADSINHYLDPHDAMYSPRLSSFIRSYEVTSPSVLKLRLRRVPMSLESLLRFPVLEYSSGQVGLEAGQSSEASGDKSMQVLSTRFELSGSDGDVRTYKRMVPEPDNLSSSQYHVAEIVEQRFVNRQQLLKSLLEGVVHVVPSVLPWEAEALKSSPDVNVVQCASPQTHVILFNPLSDRSVSAQLRRALSLAIDRETILKKTVLRDDQMKHGRTGSAVWHQASYASNPLEKAPAFDLRLSYALRFAAEKQMQIAAVQQLEAVEREKRKAAGEEFDQAAFLESVNVSNVRLPSLRMVVEPDSLAIAAAEKIVLFWKKIGIDVQVLSGAETGKPLLDDEWDLMYRRVKMTEPLLDLWPVLTNDPSCRVERLLNFPDWLRQEVISLDYAGTFTEAQRRMHQIHRHLAAQAFLIPLWEVDDYVVFRKTVSGFAERPVSAYQNVERWVLRP